MSFHVAETPTLQAVATEDEHLLAEDLQARVNEAVDQADKHTDVGPAMEGHRVARERLERLRAAERNLNQQAKSAREQAGVLSQSAQDALIDAAAAGGRLEFKKANELAVMEKQSRILGRTIERLTEHLIPLAEIASLREESHMLATRARAIERVAQERAERVLNQLREAVTEELVLPVDMSKGVAGALLARAAALKKTAVQLAESADRLEREYQKRGQGR